MRERDEIRLVIWNRFPQEVNAFQSGTKSCVSDCDQSLAMVRDPIIPEIKNRGTNGVTHWMQTATKTFQDVFRFPPFVSDHRIFHASNVLRTNQSATIFQDRDAR